MDIKEFLKNYYKSFMTYLITLIVVFSLGGIYYKTFYKESFESLVTYKMLTPFPGLRIEFDNTMVNRSVERAVAMNKENIKKCDKNVRSVDHSFSDKYLFFTVSLFHTEEIDKKKCLEIINKIVIGESEKFLDFITKKYQSITSSYIIGDGRDKPYDNLVALMADKSTFIQTEQWMEFSTVITSDRQKLFIKIVIISIIVSFIVTLLLGEIRKQSK